MRQNKNKLFYISGSGLDRTSDFQKICGQDWIGFNFIGSGLDSDWKISQSAHLCCFPPTALFSVDARFGR